MFPSSLCHRHSLKPEIGPTKGLRRKALQGDGCSWSRLARVRNSETFTTLIDSLIDWTHLILYYSSCLRSGTWKGASPSETVRQGLTFLESACSTELLCILLAYHTGTVANSCPRCSGSGDDDGNIAWAPFYLAARCVSNLRMA